MDIDTPHGPARVHIDDPSAPPNLLLVLGHGAGGGVEAPDMLAVRKAALATGAVVARVEQPYRVAGRRAPAPAHQLDAAWIAVLNALTARYPGLPVITGGRSSGGRVACRTARATKAIAVLALAFPLVPPGRSGRARPPKRNFRENAAFTPPQSSNFRENAASTPSQSNVFPEVAQLGVGGRSRAGELRDAGVPVLVVNGDRDPFGVPVPDRNVTVHVVAGADHSLRRGTAEVAGVVTAWLAHQLTAQRVREQSPSGGVGTDSPVRSEDR